MSSTDALSRRRANERLPCSARGCLSNRTHLGRFCRQHTVAVRRNGHPNGHAVSRTALAPYRDLFASFIDEHHGHTAVSAALAWSEKLIEIGKHPDSSPVHAELRRLRDAGLRGREALAAVGAVWLWSHYYSNDLPSDERLTFALARHLTLCRPQPKRFAGLSPKHKVRYFYGQPTTTTLRTLGQLIRDTLGGFFMNVVDQLEKQDRERLALAEALRTPITATTINTAPAPEEHRP